MCNISLLKTGGHNQGCVDSLSCVINIRKVPLYFKVCLHPVHALQRKAKHVKKFCESFQEINLIMETNRRLNIDF